MWLLLVEAGVALFLLVFIVWWTMFAPKPKEHEDDKKD
jgi:cbb3-type cytochrome oxidase subunit 3